MSKIIGKKYLKIEFTLASPLIIGCGKNENTDNDVLTNNLGIPYIPGTAIAGVIRSAIENMRIAKKPDMEKVFGYIEGEDSQDSRIIFYDANMSASDYKNFNISIRDSVALDKYKTARDGAKFDMEILEPGVSFVTYAELNVDENTEIKEKEEVIWSAIKSIWKAGNITFGGKTTRGMGAVRSESIKYADFDFSDKDKLEEWLEFSMYDDVGWTDAVVEKSETQGVVVLDLKLELQGGISIRRYSTDVGEADYKQLTVKAVTGNGENSDGIPVVPGTSWAGAFRHRIGELSGDSDNKLITDWFGNVDVNRTGEKSKTRSKITFSESQITGGTFKELTRTAIDRFTGGAADGALYTEKTYYGGETDLKIKIKSLQIDEDLKNALAAAIADLHGGYLAVGGLTAVGRGLFRVIAVNGDSDNNSIRNMSAAEMYEKIRTVLNEETVKGKEAG